MQFYFSTVIWHCTIFIKIKTLDICIYNNAILQCKNKIAIFELEI
jgi:hypothetical protein